MKKFSTAIIASALLLGSAVMPAMAAAPWNVTGNYELTFVLTGDNTPYTHHATLTQTGSTVTGDGGYPATGVDTYHWNVTSGTQSGNTLNLTALYDLGATGTVMHLNGTIASDGTVSGTWDDNFGGPRTGTWTLTKGVSVPKIVTPANGSIQTPATMVKVDWLDSIGATLPIEYMYEAFNNASYSGLPLYTSTWLSTSEIPTPGTAVGEYYIRVKARAGGVESAWSNGASDPYHITVALNAVPVPAECNQNVVYNVIQGTNGSDLLNGTNGADLILAKDGSDYVDGKGGNDCIVGGDGSDLLMGGAGDDVILGGDDSDYIVGDNGADKLYGEGGSDIVRGGADNDKLWGGAGSDVLQGEGGVDTADGGAASDVCSAETQTQCNP